LHGGGRRPFFLMREFPPLFSLPGFSGVSGSVLFPLLISPPGRPDLPLLKHQPALPFLCAAPLFSDKAATFFSDGPILFFFEVRSEAKVSLPSFPETYPLAVLVNGSRFWFAGRRTSLFTEPRSSFRRLEYVSFFFSLFSLESITYRFFFPPPLPPRLLLLGARKFPSYFFDISLFDLRDLLLLRSRVFFSPNRRFSSSN